MDLHVPRTFWAIAAVTTHNIRRHSAISTSVRSQVTITNERFSADRTCILSSNSPPFRWFLIELIAFMILNVRHYLTISRNRHSRIKRRSGLVFAENWNKILHTSLIIIIVSVIIILRSTVHVSVEVPREKRKSRSNVSLIQIVHTKMITILKSLSKIRG